MDDGGSAGRGHVAHSEGILLGALPRIFNAWSDEPWINEGAAVRVSLVCFGHSDAPPMLDGQAVAGIYADLTPGTEVTDSDLTTAQRLATNIGASFQGASKKGAL